MGRSHVHSPTEVSKYYGDIHLLRCVCFGVKENLVTPEIMYYLIY